MAMRFQDQSAFMFSPLSGGIYMDILISKERLYGKAYRYSVTFVLVTELSGRTFLYSS